MILNRNPDKVEKIVKALNLKILPRELKSSDTRTLLQLIFNQWLSLSTSIIQTAIDIVPPPSAAQATRIPKILYPDLRDDTLPPKNKLEEDLYSSNSRPEAFVTAYVSKMFAVSASDLPENKKKTLSGEEMRARAREARAAREAAAESGVAPAPPERISRAPSEPVESASEEPKKNAEILLGFARLYSGTLQVGSPVYAILPKYNATLDPSHPHNARYLIKAEVEGLYVMMGRELSAVDTVRAGNIFAIKGLEGKVWRSATLCSMGSAESDDLNAHKPCLVNFGAVPRAGAPIVRVALEPEMPADMPKLVNGLKLLSQSDPCVETFQQKTGEHVILAAGELHLERCLKDLRERFAKVNIQPSKPIVPFRETAVKALEMAPTKTPGASRGTIKGSSSLNIVQFTVRAAPIPSVILDYILENISILKKLQQDHKAKETGQDREEIEAQEEESEDHHGDVVRKPTVTPDRFWTVLEEKCKEAGGEWEAVADKIWAFGPQKAGGCLLVDDRKPRTAVSLRKKLAKVKSEEGSEESERVVRDFDNHIETGFQLATFQGPLCGEPVEGLAYFVEEVEVDREGLEREISQNRIAQVTGSIITSVRDACRNGLLDWSPRLMLAMYTCDIQASTDVLGKVYVVVAKRRGKIVAEEMKEGTSFFNVTALLPVVESFGFSDDIRKRTSGAASPQLIFSGYELLDIDPFWVPTTEEELEDLGEKSDRANIAKVYMDAVRERKGLFVDKKIVEFAEKQRTLKR